VAPKAVMQASAAALPAWRHSAIASWRCSSVTMSRSPAEKNCVVKSF
jgi:hypothetical protein